MYITEAELEGFIKRPLTDSEKVAFNIIVGSAQSVIDNYCDTNFNSGAVSETRYYDGNGTPEVRIDPCHNITLVKFVDTSGSYSGDLDSSNYVLEPYNKTIKWSVRLRASKFARGVKNIGVTGVFSSYDTKVPDEVKFACFKLCADALSNPSGMESESIEGYSYKMRSLVDRDAEIKSGLAKFRRVLV